MAIKLVKPERYSICAGCGTTKDLGEYQFTTGSDSIKVCLTLCKSCVYTMSKLEVKDDKRTENN